MLRGAAASTTPHGYHAPVDALVRVLLSRCAEASLIGIQQARLIILLVRAQDPESAQAIAGLLAGVLVCRFDAAVVSWRL